MLNLIRNNLKNFKRNIYVMEICFKMCKKNHEYIFVHGHFFIGCNSCNYCIKLLQSRINIINIADSAAVDLLYMWNRVINEVLRVN